MSRPPRCPRRYPHHAAIGFRLMRAHCSAAAAAVAAASLALAACSGGSIAQGTPASNGQSFVSGDGGTTVFKGSSAVRSELAVSVRVGSVDGSAGSDSVPFVPWMSLEAASPLPDLETSQQQQQ